MSKKHKVSLIFKEILKKKLIKNKDIVTYVKIEKYSTDWLSNKHRDIVIFIKLENKHKDTMKV